MFSKISSSTLLSFMSFIGMVQRSLQMNANLDSIVQFAMSKPCFGNYASVGGVNTVLLLDDCVKKIRQATSFYGKTVGGDEDISFDQIKFKMEGISAFALGSKVPRTTIPVRAVWTKSVNAEQGVAVKLGEEHPTQTESYMIGERGGYLYVLDEGGQMGDAGRGAPFYIYIEGIQYLAGMQAGYINGDKKYNVYYPVYVPK